MARCRHVVFLVCVLCFIAASLSNTSSLPFVCKICCDVCFCSCAVLPLFLWTHWRAHWEILCWLIESKTTFVWLLSSAADNGEISQVCWNCFVVLDWSLRPACLFGAGQKTISVLLQMIKFNLANGSDFYTYILYIFMSTELRPPHYSCGPINLSLENSIIQRQSFPWKQMTDLTCQSKRKRCSIGFPSIAMACFKGFCILLIRGAMPAAGSSCVRWERKCIILVSFSTLLVPIM